MQEAPAKSDLVIAWSSGGRDYIRQWIDFRVDHKEMTTLISPLMPQRDATSRQNL